MAAFRPLLLPEPLPQPGAAIEHATFDAKARADLTKPFHLAKDVAAFANHLGGNIVIGVPEDKGVLLAPVPLTPKEAADTRNAFSKEVAKRCSPPPLIDFGEYPMAAGFVVTVVVFPYVGQPVGVRVNADTAKGGYGGEAFAFPLRVGADTSYLEPEQLSMLMLPDYRRVVVALGAIPAGASVKLHLLAAPAHGIGIAKTSFGGIDVLTNTLTLAPGPQPYQDDSLRAPVTIPIDYVATVWQGDDGWEVAVRGQLRGTFLPALR